MTRILGITGSLGTGKSTVAQLLTAHAIPVWDADIAARRAVAPQTLALAMIRQRYGAQVFTADGNLNRQSLGKIIFTEPRERQWLEALLHPWVRHDAQAWLAVQTQPTVALVVPLLFEAQMTDLVTEIWVLSCSLAQQWQRVRIRDGLTEQEFSQRLASQWPLAQKITYANLVLPNDGSVADLAGLVAAALLP